MRIVVTEGHEVEDTFLKNRNSGFVTFSSLAPSDYTIQKVGLDKRYICIRGVKYSGIIII